MPLLPEAIPDRPSGLLIELTLGMRRAPKGMCMLSSDRNFHMPTLEERIAGVEDRPVSSHRQLSHKDGKGYDEKMGRKT